MVGLGVATWALRMAYHGAACSQSLFNDICRAIHAAGGDERSLQLPSPTPEGIFGQHPLDHTADWLSVAF